MSYLGLGLGTLADPAISVTLVSKCSTVQQFYRVFSLIFAILIYFICLSADLKGFLFQKNLQSAYLDS